MKRSIVLPIFLLGGLFLLSLQATSTPAQPQFKKSLQSKYNLKTVSCYTCHLKKSEVAADQLDAFKKKSKAFRNGFGKEFEKLLKDKNITARLAKVKELDSTDPKKMKVVSEVSKEFLEALQKIAEVKSPSGPTYDELLKKGTLKGVKPKETEAD